MPGNVLIREKPIIGVTELVAAGTIVLLDVSLRKDDKIVVCLGRQLIQ